MVNYSSITSRIREKKRRHAINMKDMSSLMEFLEKEIRKSLSNTTGINAMII